MTLRCCGKFGASQAVTTVDRSVQLQKLPKPENIKGLLIPVAACGPGSVGAMLATLVVFDDNFLS
jgi:hypothetical protein